MTSLFPKQNKDIVKIGIIAALVVAAVILLKFSGFSFSQLDVFLAGQNSSRTPGAKAWTESWDSIAGVQSRWNAVGTPCYSVPQPGILELVCQSGGLTSKQYWNKDRRIELVGTVRAEAGPGSSTSSFWGGLTIYNNDGLDNNYGELAVERNVPPFAGDYTARIVSLTNDIGAKLGITDIWVWHTFKIVYTPPKSPNPASYGYYVDGNLVQTVPNYELRANPDIFVLCVSVGVNTPDDGSSARCQFGPVTVSGTLVR